MRRRPFYGIVILRFAVPAFSEKALWLESVIMRRLATTWRFVVMAFTVATLVHAYRTKQSHDRYMNIPFGFRFPTPGRIRKRLWSPEDKRIFSPSIFGVGWSVNAHQVAIRVGLIEDLEYGEAR